MRKKTMNYFIFFVRIWMGVSLLLFLTGIAKVNPADEQQQKKIITGKVSDAKGEAILGASVVVKGTTNGTVTNPDGAFTLSNVSVGETVAISYIGFLGQEIIVENRNEYAITLQEDNKALDKVVVVGYGVQKKVNLTGSVSSIGASKLENRSAPNLSTSMAGLAAGVSVRQSSDNPGSNGANILIRGVGTFASNYRAPMVIVDGVESSMDAVNPNDVETISILKDAASASIYGLRGANGVVLVTTRKATPTITYSGMLSNAQPSPKHKFLWDYAEQMDLLNMAQKATNPTGQLIYNQDGIDRWRAAKNDPNGLSEFTWPDSLKVPNWVAYPNTNWADVGYLKRIVHFSLTGW